MTTIPRLPGATTIPARPVAMHVQAAADDFVASLQMSADIVGQLRCAAALLRSFADGATHHDRAAVIKGEFMDRLAQRVSLLSDDDRAAFLSIARDSLNDALPTLN